MPFLLDLIIYHRKQFQMMRGLLEIFIFHQGLQMMWTLGKLCIYSIHQFIFHQRHLVPCKWCEPWERFACPVIAQAALISSIYQELSLPIINYPDVSWIIPVYQKKHPTLVSFLKIDDRLSRATLSLGAYQYYWEWCLRINDNLQHQAWPQKNASEMLVAPQISHGHGLPWSALVCYSLPWLLLAWPRCIILHPHSISLHPHCIHMHPPASVFICFICFVCFYLFFKIPTLSRFF